MSAAASRVVSNRGVPLLYDDAGCKFFDACKGKAKEVNGRIINYQDHYPEHNPPDFAKEIGNSTTEVFNSKLHVSTKKLLFLSSVPPHSSAQKVASILAEHDRFYMASHALARRRHHTLAQQFPQSRQTANIQFSRYIAVSNGAMGKAPLELLQALTTHIH
ncbi:hypothetical protein PENTCL1PPCAC_140, partial [Pristionchus entomophagus]